MSADPEAPRVELAIIGAGPTASSLLERLAANAPQLLSGGSVRIHLIDPHRAGTGRVWRADNHPGLWMNSLAEDVTLFTDDSVVCDGPIRPGSSLFEWAHSIDDETLGALAPPELIAEIRSLTGTSFPTRRVQTVYLGWFHQQVIAGLPAGMEVVVHTTSAIDLIDDDGQQVVVLENGDELRVDVAVLTLGHLDALPDDRSRALGEFADRNGLTYVGPGHTAELDLAGLAAGEDVISVGFGQAFTDLLVLVTEGRGGRFVQRADGSVGYEPSGQEPVIHVGSRRGVPYRSKLDYRLQATPAPLPRFLDEPTIQALLQRDEELEFRHDLLPLVAKEVGWAYYYELFQAHPERVAVSWAEFDAQYAAALDDGAQRAVVAASVPAPADHFDIGRLDAPLAGQHFASAADAHQHIRDHVSADVARRTNPEFSADLAAFNALLQTFAIVARIAASGRLSPRSRVEDVSGWWFSFFMYYASGPPPARLLQLLALEKAGLVRFLGADIAVRADDERKAFVATSSSHPDELVATVLIDALVAVSSVSRTASPLLQRLRDRGEVVEEVVVDAAGWKGNTGKVVVAGPVLNVARVNAPAHPRRHALGLFTNRPAAGAFARPRTNALPFRQNDSVARAILITLASTQHRAAAWS